MNVHNREQRGQKKTNHKASDTDSNHCICAITNTGNVNDNDTLEFRQNLLHFFVRLTVFVFILSLPKYIVLEIRINYIIQRFGQIDRFTARCGSKRTT